MTDGIRAHVATVPRWPCRRCDGAGVEPCRDCLRVYGACASCGGELVVPCDACGGDGLGPAFDA